jgi:hypothetical protein
MARSHLTQETLRVFRDEFDDIDFEETINAFKNIDDVIRDVLFFRLGTDNYGGFNVRKALRAGDNFQAIRDQLPDDKISLFNKTMEYLASLVNTLSALDDRAQNALDDSGRSQDLLPYWTALDMKAQHDRLHNCLNLFKGLKDPEFQGKLNKQHEYITDTSATTSASPEKTVANLAYNSF